MNAADVLVARLHRMLDGGLPSDEWSGDEDTRKALSNQWQLARLVATGTSDQRQQHIRNLEDAAKSEIRVRTDHAGRYPIELLQNAQDACADAGVRGSVWFRVTERALLVANQGVPFDASRVSSLIRLGGTTKKPGDPEHHTIGYKGIGFTSVLQITDCPQIISQGVAFELNRGLAVQELEGLLKAPVAHIPVRYFPFPLTPVGWSDDEDTVEDLLDHGATTIVRLPFRENVLASEVSAAVTSLLGPTSLLLMPALDALDIGDGTAWTRRRGHKLAGGQLHHLRSTEGDLSSWLLSEQRVPAPKESLSTLDDEVWSDVKTLHVAVGVPWADGAPSAAGQPDSKVYAYFPTDDTIGRSLVLHGDFFLQSNRRHIQAEGPGAEISMAICRGLIDLLASMAEAFCEERPDGMPQLLECLSEGEAPQGFGSVIAEALDERLRRCAILRTTTGERVTPENGRLLGVDIPLDRAADLASMLPSLKALVAPQFEQAGGPWLRKLGAAEISPYVVVPALQAAEAPTYDRAVLAVAEWWTAKNRWNQKRLLADARILQSTEGAWHVADELCEPVQGIPRLPPGMERETYVPPRDPEAAEFLADEIDVQPLDLPRALDLVLGGLADGSYGGTDEECKAAHRFALSAFRRDPNAVSRHKGRGAIPVPVRSWRRGPASGWRAARHVYFTYEWTGKADLERLYRRFGEPEFIAVEPPFTPRRRKELKRFYQAIGVSDRPRVVVLRGGLWRAPGEWQSLEDVRRAAQCVDGHPQTPREFAATTIDRLPELIEGTSDRESEALANLLSASSEPYGSPADVWCTHSAHRTPNRRPATGVQRWILEHKPWVPVVNDPLDRKFVVPGEAWLDVNGEALEACLGQAHLPESVARKLGLPSATHPEAGAAASALVTLKTAFPVLSEASANIQEGAAILIQRFSAALRRSDRKYQGPRPPLPSRKAGQPLWATTAAIPDVDLPPDIPLALLPQGSWEPIRLLYRLPLASAQVTRATDIVGDEPAELDRLGASDRVSLAALLAARGADLRAIAPRLGRLKVRRCTAIRSTVRVAEFESRQEVGAHLKVDDKRDGTLYVTVPLSTETQRETAQLLAAHLGVADQVENVLLYLTFGDELLRLHGVSDAALNEAEGALRRYVSEETRAPLPRPEVQRAKTGKVEAAPPVATAGQVISKDPASSTSFQQPQRPTPLPIIRVEGSRDEPERLRDENLRFSSFERAGGDEPQHRNRQGAGPSGARGGTGKSGGTSVSADARRASEVGAISVATRFALDELGYAEVRDVQEENKGWDIEFVRPDGSWRPVEVKGFSATATAFIITRNELAAAREHTGYLVMLVTGVGGDSGEVICLDNVRDWISEIDLDAMSWAVTGWGEHGQVMQWSVVKTS